MDRRENKTLEELSSMGDKSANSSVAITSEPRDWESLIPDSCRRSRVARRDEKEQERVWAAPMTRELADYYTLGKEELVEYYKWGKKSSLEDKSENSSVTMTSEPRDWASRIPDWCRRGRDHVDLRDEKEQKRLWEEAYGRERALYFTLGEEELREYYTWGDYFSKNRKRKGLTDFESGTKKQVYEVRDADKIGVLVECEKCGLIKESKISKSMPKPSSDDHEHTTTSPSLKQTVKVTHTFYCPKCKIDKTVLEYEEDEEEEKEYY